MNDQLSSMTTQEAGLAIRAAMASSPDAPIIVDFDETLWLRNSTEEYLRHLRPRWMAYLILLALEAVRPWKFMPHDRAEHLYRDWLRVLVCTICMPWSLWLWRRAAAKNAQQWANQPLLAILSEAGPARIHVATLGIDVIVAPLLRHIDPDAVLCAAGTLWSGHHIRRIGKKVWIEQRHADVAVADALVITDNIADADLLGGCRSPILVTWPDAEYRSALSDAYIPFLYTQRAKRPGEKYMLYGFLLEDVVVLWLAFAWLMPAPLLGAVALLLLHLSFWAIYEIGYVENDSYAVKNEAAPKIHPVAAAYAQRVTPWKAWLTSALFGAAGVVVLVQFNSAGLTTAAWALDPAALTGLLFVLWMAYVAVSRAAFWLYNHLDTQSRGHFYVVLQLLRSVGYALFVRTNLVGVVILLSLALARWIKYLVYRNVGKTFDEDQRFLTLIFFLILACGVLALDPASLITLQALVALLWFAAYAHRRLRQILRHAKVA